MRIFLLFCGLLLGCIYANAQKTFIYCGQLIDVKSGKTLTAMTIVVEGKKITDVQNGYTKTGNDDKVIDLKNRTVMPGLIDMHVHLEGETKRGAAINRFVENPTDVAFESIKYAGYYTDDRIYNCT